jgi:nicotinamidase-related amidase
MPLVDRSDSVLTIVDAQPAFFDQAKMTEDERATAAATVDRIAWLAGVASLLDIPVVVVEEGADRNGATDPRILERLGPNSSVHGKSTFSLTGCDAAVDRSAPLARAPSWWWASRPTCAWPNPRSACMSVACGPSSSRMRRTRGASSTVVGSPA